MVRTRSQTNPPNKKTVVASTSNASNASSATKSKTVTPKAKAKRALNFGSGAPNAKKAGSGSARSQPKNRVERNSYAGPVDDFRQSLRDILSEEIGELNRNSRSRSRHHRHQSRRGRSTSDRKSRSRHGHRGRRHHRRRSPSYSSSSSSYYSSSSSGSLYSSEHNSPSRSNKKRAGTSMEHEIPQPAKRRGRPPSVAAQSIAPQSIARK